MAAYCEKNYWRYQTMRGLMAANNASAEALTQIAAEKPSRMYMADTNEASADRRHGGLRPATRRKLRGWGAEACLRATEKLRDGSQGSG